MPSKRPEAKRSLHPIEQADLAVAAAVAVDGRTRKARRIDAIADLGDQPPLRILCGLTIAAGAFRGDSKMIRTGIRMLAAHTVATAAKTFFKNRIDRTRPGDALEKGHYRLGKGRSRAKWLTSMPSGHSAGVAAVASALAREYPDAAPVAGMAAATIIAAQLPAKNHYLSDVAAGTAIGIAAEAALDVVMRAAADADA